MPIDLNEVRRKDSGRFCGPKAAYLGELKHLFPDQFNDAARAVAWLHAEVANYGADPRRVFIGGHSAGGHYAALLAVRRDWQARFGVPVDVLKGCLPVSGVYDLTASGGLAVRPRFLGSAGAAMRSGEPNSHLQNKSKVSAVSFVATLMSKILITSTARGSTSPFSTASRSTTFTRD